MDSADSAQINLVGRQELMSRFVLLGAYEDNLVGLRIPHDPKTALMI